MKRGFLYLVMFSFLCASVIGPSDSASGEQFYDGKTIKIIVGFSPGGGFDTFSRVLARHMGKYLPGKQTILVQNMPGAGSLISANRVYAMQPGDGLTIVNFNAAVINRAVLKAPGVTIDPQKFLWIGQPSVGSVPQVLWFRPEVVKSLDELLKSKKPLHIGSAGPGSSIHEISRYYESLGMNVKMVAGYGGTADIFAAIERKEVDGISLSLATAQSVYSRFLDEGKIVPVLSLGGHPLVKPLKGVPTFEDFVKKAKLSKENEALGRFLINVRALLRLYAVPPGTPLERVKALREAFAKSFQDPKLMKDAERTGILVAPLTAEDIETKVAEIMQTPDGILDIYRSKVMAQ